MVALNLHSDVVDNGLNLIVTNASTVFMCNALPTTYAEASSTYKLGSASIGFNSPGAATAGDGRKITSNPITGGVITGTGTVSHWGVCDGSRLLAAGAIDAPEAVTDGWEFSLGALSLVLPFEVISGGGEFTNSWAVRDQPENDSLARLTQQAGTSRRVMTFSYWIKALASPPSDSDNVTQLTLVVVDAIWLRGASGFDITLDSTGGNYHMWPASGGAIPDNNWHHYVVQIDTTQATPADRVKGYVDGSQITWHGSSTFPPQNYDTHWGNASDAETICDTTDAMGMFDWYYDEFAYVDGQTLAPSAFAENGLPKDLSSIDFGNNGYWLRFETGQLTTIGQDYSGNGNDFMYGEVTGWTQEDFTTDVPGSAFPNYYSVTDNDNDSLARTGSQKAGTSRRIMTFSCWIKSLAADADRVTWENTMYISGVVYDGIQLQGDIGLMANFDNTGTPKYVRTNYVPVAAGWHHYVIQIDTTQATPSDRVKFFVDGQEQAKDATSTYPSQNYDTAWGSGGQSELICDMTDAGGLWPWRYDEWVLVDGQILAPSEFADGNNKPKDLSGIDFGNNGYWLRFEEFATEAEMGLDSSGNGNNFTPSGGNWLGDESTDVP